MGYRQNILSKRVSHGGYPGLFSLFLIYISSIAGGTKLECQLDVVLFVQLKRFLDLTCDFWVENAKNSYKWLMELDLSPSKSRGDAETATWACSWSRSQRLRLSPPP